MIQAREALFLEHSISSRQRMMPIFGTGKKSLGTI